jgi:DNA-binding response OmpR family regulator
MDMAEPFDGKSVLIVDDDEDILTAIEEAFKITGAEVSTAKDGNTAVKMAMDNNPDLLVLDAMLPGRSGFLVLEKLKGKKPRGSKPYVIMITGNTGKRHQVWAESLGAEAYINKPFPMDRLMNSAEKLLAAD